MPGNSWNPKASARRGDSRQARHPSHMARVKRLIELTRQEPEFARSKVILGGNLLRSHPDLWRTLGADGYAEEAAGALPILDDWWAEARG